MDEMWQRHKSFILQVMAGGVMFVHTPGSSTGRVGQSPGPGSSRVPPEP